MVERNSDLTTTRLVGIETTVDRLQSRGIVVPHLRFGLEDGRTHDIPLLSIRNPNHHVDIARIASSGLPLIFAAGGVIGGMTAVRRKDSDDPHDYPCFDMKPDRSSKSRYPMLARHEDQTDMIAWRKLHPGSRILERARARAEFSGDFPLHVIYPFNDADTLTDRTVFVTRPDDIDLAKRPDMKVNIDTVCLFFHRDPDWLRVANLAGSFNDLARWAVTSCNPHKLIPPFTLDEFKDDLIKRSGEGYKLWELTAAAIINDEISDIADVGSSHTQVRLQHVGEANLDGETDVPTVFVVRIGSLSPEGLQEHLNGKFGANYFKVQVLPSALKEENRAKRKYPHGVNLDWRLKEQARLVRELHQNGGYSFLPLIRKAA